jgi:polysaccharide biosynthesis/export protein
MSLAVFGQQLDPAKWTALLQEKGVSQGDFQAAMLAKGVTPTTAATMDPEQLQVIAMQVIDGLAKLEKPTIIPPGVNVVEDAADPSKTSTPVPPVGSDEKLDQPTQKVSDIYGMDVLRSGNVSSYVFGSEDRPSDAYVLGQGDKITINIWGVAAFTGSYDIGNDGYIRPDRVPPIYLKGMSLGKARGMLKSRFGQFYPFIGDNFDVIVSGTRKVTINVSGEVNKYGSYTMSATNSAISALISAGGPTDIGTLRRIRLLRQGESPKTLDIYEFLQNPALVKDFTLQDNDFIHVPTSGRMVQISGAVRRPMKYELLDGEQLIKVLEFAGGLTSNAYTNQINIKRFEKNKEILVSVDLASLLANRTDFALLNGDEISISTISMPADNFVEADGEVAYPGALSLSPGMRISDLANKAMPRPSARLDIVFLERKNPDQTIALFPINLSDILRAPGGVNDLVLKNGDKLVIYPKARYIDKADITIVGSVRVPGNYPFDTERKVRVSDLVNLAGGLIPNATPFGYIVRKDSTNFELPLYQRVNLEEAMRGNLAENFVILPFDTLFIQSNEDFTTYSNVSIMGEVNKEGEYAFAPGLTLTDLLTFSGGLKLTATSTRIEIYRVDMTGNDRVRTIAATVEVDDKLNIVGSPDGVTLQPFDQIIVRKKPNFNYQQYVVIKGEVLYPGSYALLSDNEPISSLIQRAGGLTTEAFVAGATINRSKSNIGFILVDMTKAINNDNSRDNIPLEEGDLIMIPKIYDLVYIAGSHRASEIYPERYLATANTITISYAGPMSAIKYVKKYALGPSKEADLSNIIVEHPNGRLKRTKNFGLFRIYPKVSKGARVFVPRKPAEPIDPNKPAGDPPKEIDWNEVVTNTVQQAIQVLSLILLVERIN